MSRLDPKAGRRMSVISGSTALDHSHDDKTRKFSKAINLVKFALRVDNPGTEESELSHAGRQQGNMENTYRMSPEPGAKFRPQQVEGVIREIFAAHLEDYVYDKATAPSHTKQLCTMIKERVKKLRFTRFKIVCNVFICALTGQGMEACSRGVWDDKTDSYAVVTHRGTTFHAVALVHAVYFE